jgi:hypothetical protein
VRWILPKFEIPIVTNETKLLFFGHGLSVDWRNRFVHWLFLSVTSKICEVPMGSVIKKRRKRMSKKKHRKLLRKTRHQRRNKK